MQSITDGTTGLLPSSSSSPTVFAADVKPPISPNESFRRLSMSESSAGSFCSSVASDSAIVNYRPSPLDIHMAAAAAAAAATRGGGGSSSVAFPSLPSPVVGCSYMLPSPSGGGYLSPTELKGEPLGALRDLQAFTRRGVITGPSAFGSGGGGGGSTATSGRVQSSSTSVIHEDRHGGSGRAVGDCGQSASMRDRCVCTFCGCSRSADSDRAVYTTADMSSPNDVEPMTTTKCADSDSGSSSPVDSRPSMLDADGDPRVFAPTSMTAELSPDTTMPPPPPPPRDVGSRNRDAAAAASLLSPDAPPLELNKKYVELAMAAKQPYNERRRELIERATENIISAHMQTCNYTMDRLAANLRGYESMMSGKPEVRNSPLLITFRAYRI
jgi:hypothetical protein